MIYLQVTNAFIKPLAIYNRGQSKIEGLFQYLDHDIPKTSNQAEHAFSLFQPIIDAGKSFSTGVGNFSEH